MARHSMALTVLGLLAAFPLVTAQIRVVTPQSLVRDLPNMGRIDGSTATFGAPFYGDRVMGRLVWVEPKPGSAPHCDQDYKLPEPRVQGGDNGGDNQARLINIVLVRRGGCSFTTKVSVAASKGAHAVVIVDRQDSDITQDTINNIVVADDGFGDKITIPSVLITKELGAKLIDAAKRDQVVIELAWDLPTDHVVQMDLWMSSASLQSNIFLHNFAPYRRKLNQVMSFVPHYAVFSLDGSDPKIYNELCTDATGRFCAEDPDAVGPITGKDVVEEDVRQLCIHETHKVKRPTQQDVLHGHPGVEYSAQFWDYIERFLHTCPLDAANPQDRFGLECSKRVMSQAGVNVAAVEECVRRNTQRFLTDQLEHIAWSPRAMRINGWRYSGILDPDLVTRAICSGFIEKPRECEDLLKPRDPTVPYTSQSPPGGMSTGSMIFWALIVVGAIGVAFQVYKVCLKRELQRTLREEVMLEVQAQMGEYAKLGGN